MARFKHRRSRRRFRKNGLRKVKKDIKWLKKNIEFKFKDLTVTNQDASNAPTLLLLNGVANGPLVVERTGDELTARRIVIRGKIENTNGTPVDTIVRIILFRERRVNGVVPVLGDVLAATGTAAVLSWRNMDDKNNIKVMFDTTFTMDTTQHSLIPFKLIYKLNHQTLYSGVGTGVSSIQTNGLFLVVISEVAAGANAPTVDFTSRYSFVDS